MVQTDWIYGAIFSGYVACFIFIAVYMMIRKKRDIEIKSSSAKTENDKATTNETKEKDKKNQ